VQGRLALLLGGAVVAGAAVYRTLTRRPPAPVVPEPHVEALKARLAESKAVVEEREEFEAGETPVDQVESMPTELGDRRASVHDRGRQVADEMRRGANPPE
jgi:predicted kinase